VSHTNRADKTDPLRFDRCDGVCLTYFHRPRSLILRTFFRPLHNLSQCHDLLGESSMPEASVKLVREMLEVLQDGTERGKPVAVSGISAYSDCMEMTVQRSINNARFSLPLS
jgi:hypothetical protein